MSIDVLDIRDIGVNTVVRENWRLKTFMVLTVSWMAIVIGGGNPDRRMGTVHKHWDVFRTVTQCILFRSWVSDMYASLDCIFTKS